MVPALLTKLYSEPWLIEQSYVPALLRSAIEGLNKTTRTDPPSQGLRTTGEKSAGLIIVAEQPQAEALERFGATAVISIRGPILKFPGCNCGCCCDVDSIAMAAEIAAADPTIEQVILRIDSPGGTITGIPEAAEALAALAQEKPLYAFTESCMCSAAYWLGSQAETIYATPSARIGSIGVFALYFDQSKLLEEMGVKVNAISVGQWKLAGAPFKPMSDEERAYFQSSADKIAQDFYAAVTASRKVSPELMQGQVFYSAAAVEGGLCDLVVPSFSDLLQMIQ